MKKKVRFLPLVALAFALSGIGAKDAFAYDKDYIGKMEIHRADFEDTLVHLARANGLGFVEMRAANPSLDPWIPGSGARVVLPTQHILPDAPREGIVINLPEMRLYLFEKKGSVPLSYPISPGREGLYTPVGTTTISRKMEGPTWRPTARMRKENPTLKASYAPGPDNPLGTHALYLGWPEYLIHGTDKPYAIGRLASSGCIRMYPESITDLYPRVPTGSKVTVVDQPVKVGWIENKMYVEVSPTMEQSTRVEQDGEFKSYEITSDDMKRITAKAGAQAELIDWEAVRKAVREHRGYPVAVLDRAGTKGAHVADEIEDRLKEEAAKDSKEQAAKAAAAVPVVKAPEAPAKKAAAKPETAKKPAKADKTAKAETEPKVPPRAPSVNN